MVVASTRIQGKEGPAGDKSQLLCDMCLWRDLLDSLRIFQNLFGENCRREEKVLRRHHGGRNGNRLHSIHTLCSTMLSPVIHQRSEWVSLAGRCCSLWGQLILFIPIRYSQATPKIIILVFSERNKLCSVCGLGDGTKGWTGAPISESQTQTLLPSGPFPYFFLHQGGFQLGQD